MGQQSHEVVTEVFKAAPPVAVVTTDKILQLSGLSLNELVMLATLAYISLQAFVLVRDKIWPGRKRAIADDAE